MSENRIMSVMLKRDTSSATVSDTVALASTLESPMARGISATSSLDFAIAAVNQVGSSHHYQASQPQRGKPSSHLGSSGTRDCLTSAFRSLSRPLGNNSRVGPRSRSGIRGPRHQLCPSGACRARATQSRLLGSAVCFFVHLRCFSNDSVPAIIIFDIFHIQG